MSLDNLDEFVKTEYDVRRQRSPGGVESSTNSLQWRMHASLASSASGAQHSPNIAVGPTPTEASGAIVLPGPSEVELQKESPIRTYLNIIAGALVFLNSLSQIIELEMKGRSAGFVLGMAEGADFTPYLHFFRYSDTFFDVAFLIEWVILVADQRFEFLSSSANAFDSFLVAAWLLG